MKITNKVAKKLGEVLSFNRIGQDTIEKGRVTLEAALGKERLMDMEEKFRIHGEEIMRVATDAGVIDLVLKESDEHDIEFKKMRDLYIGKNWDSITEIMEWTGFFEGAAVVHWAFIRGAAEALNDELLMTLAEEGKNYRYELLEMAESELETRGQDQAMA